MDLKFYDNNSNSLIFFLAGWGCDERQFAHLKSHNYDILIAYNYVNLEIDFDFSKYKEINLISFSAGVFIAGFIKDTIPKLKRKIAINGNPLSNDKYYGISDELAKVFLNVSKDNAIEFRRKYMVNSEAELIKFNECQPHRSLESCLKEFRILQEYYKISIEPMNFDLVFLSENDKIFNIERQKEYFKDTQIKIISNAGHFPFFKFKTYDELFVNEFFDSENCRNCQYCNA